MVDWILALNFLGELLLLPKFPHGHVSHSCIGYDIVSVLKHASAMVLNHCVRKILSCFQVFGIRVFLYISAILVSLLLFWWTPQDL